MSDHDCLIWVDGPYRTVNQFIKEAERRGCCRKVPFWPSWAKPGKTRVFLAHRAGHDRTDRGSIFGYFTLHGVDIVFTQEKCEGYKALLSKYHEAPRDQKDLEPLVDFWREEFHGKRLPVTLPAKPAADPKKPSPSYDGSIIDFILDFLISCKPNGDGSGAPGYGISQDQTNLEADRICGARPGNPALYFVDALAREIESVFCEILKEIMKKALEEEGEEEEDTRKKKRAREIVAELTRKAKRNKKNGRRQGIPEFQHAVKKVLSRAKRWATVPKELDGFADKRGALVVFERSYPSFRRLPQAAFLGLLRIDGDQLLEKISDVYASRSRRREIELPYYKTGQVGAQQKKTKQQLIADLAQEWQASKEFVEEIWRSFHGMITHELVKRGKITLTNVGTLSVKKSRGVKEVKFEQSKVLKRKII